MRRQNGENHKLPKRGLRGLYDRPKIPGGKRIPKANAVGPQGGRIVAKLSKLLWGELLGRGSTQLKSTEKKRQGNQGRILPSEPDTQRPQ